MAIFQKDFRHSISLLLFLLCYAAGIAQEQQSDNSELIDSLEAELRDHAALDQEKVDLLNRLGFEYWIVNPRQSEAYGTQALEIAKLLPYPSGKAYANRVIGVAHWVRGNLDLSFRFLLEAEAQYQKLGDTLGLANSMLNLGMAYADQQNFSVARRKYEQALKRFDRLKESGRMATTYTKIAELLIQQESYDNAYEYLLKALDIHKANNFLYGMAEANAKLGTIFLARGDYNEAISYLLLAVEAARQRNDSVGLADYFHMLALSFYRKGDFRQAQAYLQNSENLAEQYQLKKILRAVYQTHKDLEVERGNYRNALQYYDRYLAVKDELFNEEISNIIASMEARRAFEEKEQELRIAQKNLDLLKQKNKADRLTKLALALGIIALLAIAWGIWQRQNKLLSEKQKDLDRAETRTDELEDAIQTKEQELTSYTFNFVRKNELITDLQQSLQDLRRKVDARHHADLNTLSRQVDQILRVDEDWEDFRKHFENAHPNLIRRLNRDFPDLTANEFKLIALIRLNLSSKEISSVLGISPDSVKTARYRLRKKLQLESGEDLFDFLIRFAERPPQRGPS